MKSKINVFWQSPRNTNEGDFDNFGDILSKYIVEYLTDLEIVWKRPNDIKWYHRNKTVFLTAGSIAKQANKYSIIWGSGIKERYLKVRKVKKILAVRGPRTREIFVEKGFKVPEIYGDPALLCPRIFPLKRRARYIGIIPHYVDHEEVSEYFNNHVDYKVIDLKNSVQTVLDDILQCESVFSSSLHGIIVPHAYGIPAFQVKFSEKVSGDGIKYIDYFESLKIPPYPPLSVDLTLPFLRLNNALINFKNEYESSGLPDPIFLEETVLKLLEVCPFNHNNR